MSGPTLERLRAHVGKRVEFRTTTGRTWRGVLRQLLRTGGRQSPDLAVIDLDQGETVEISCRYVHLLGAEGDE